MGQVAGGGHVDGGGQVGGGGHDGVGGHVVGGGHVGVGGQVIIVVGALQRHFLEPVQPAVLFA